MDELEGRLELLAAAAGVEAGEDVRADNGVNSIFFAVEIGLLCWSARELFVRPLYRCPSGGASDLLIAYLESTVVVDIFGHRVKH